MIPPPGLGLKAWRGFNANNKGQHADVIRVSRISASGHLKFVKPEDDSEWTARYRNRNELSILIDTEDLLRGRRLTRPMSQQHGDYPFHGMALLVHVP